MSFSDAERSELAQLFLELGPDAPTMCEGWLTRDLAAHLWVREHRSPALVGMAVAPLSGVLDRAMDQARERDYEQLVQQWHAGPKGLNPWRVLDSQVNFFEHFIHHEDVRRVNGHTEPREFSAEVNDRMMAQLPRISRLLLRSASRPVVALPTGGRPVVLRERLGRSSFGEDIIRVSGQPGEIALWVFGRDAAQVTVSGNTDGLTRGA